MAKRTATQLVEDFIQERASHAEDNQKQVPSDEERLTVKAEAPPKAPDQGVTYTKHIYTGEQTGGYSMAVNKGRKGGFVLRQHDYGWLEFLLERLPVGKAILVRISDSEELENLKTALKLSKRTNRHQWRVVEVPSGLAEISIR